MNEINNKGDQSVDDVLASIRKILTDENPKSTDDIFSLTNPQTTAPSDASEGKEEVFELTDLLNEDGSIVEAKPGEAKPQGVVENTIVTPSANATLSPEPEVAQPTPPPVSTDTKVVEEIINLSSEINKNAENAASVEPVASDTPQVEAMEVTTPQVEAMTSEPVKEVAVEAPKAEEIAVSTPIKEEVNITPEKTLEVKQEEVVMSEEKPLVSASAKEAAFASLESLKNLGGKKEDNKEEMDLHKLSFDEVVKEMIKDNIKSWLDTNLPPMVESIVKSEIQKLVSEFKSNQ